MKAIEFQSQEPDKATYTLPIKSIRAVEAGDNFLYGLVHVKGMRLGIAVTQADAQRIRQAVLDFYGGASPEPLDLKQWLIRELGNPPNGSRYSVGICGECGHRSIWSGNCTGSTTCDCDGCGKRTTLQYTQITI